MTVETPGLVCAHHHLYSSLARGMPSPPRTPTTFLEILEQIWWRLDRALDLELVRWSARLGALEALEAGTTGIVDHHSSPERDRRQPRRDRRRLRRGRSPRALLLRGHRPQRARRGEGGTGRERAVPPRRRRRLRRRARVLHPLRRHPRRGVRTSPPISASGCTCTSRRARSTRVPAPDSSLTPISRGCWPTRCTCERPLPGTVVHNPRSNLNNAVGYGAPGALRPRRARYRRHRRRHARGVPPRVRAGPFP